jgi:hypothetical protein
MPTTTMKESKKTPLSSRANHEVAAGTILIKNGALLPKELEFETEPGVPGWRFVKDFDVRGMDRKIQKTGWTFFCLAGEIKATAFGIDPQRMVRTAIERILAKSKSQDFNSLEITQMASAGSERFPLIRYITVSAQSRHIQESMFLGRGAAEADSAKNKVDPRGAAKNKKPQAPKPAIDPVPVPS